MSGFVRTRFAQRRICQRRSPVVDRGARARQLERGERPRLVLRQRLRRVEVERAQLRVACDGVEHGQVEGERLAGGGSRRDDDVLAALCRVPRLALVHVERVERQRLADARVQVVRERREASLPRGLGGEVRDLLAFEQVVPAGELDGHELNCRGTGKVSRRAMTGV
jgi:hypothetical protein